jgi:hypothetical protein
MGIWLFDEGKGETAKDSSGNNNDGTLKNDPKWVKGKIDTALSFDGVDDYVEVPDADSLKLADTITIVAWVKLKSLDRFHGVVGKTGSIWSDASYSTRIINSNEYNFTTRTTGDAAHHELSGGTADTDWHHVVYWFSRPTKMIYVDEKKIAEDTWDHPIQTNNQTLSIGAYAWGNGLNYLMNGLIDEVGIFNVALTEDDIKDIMNKGLEGVTAVSPSGKLTTTWGDIKQ